MDWTRIEGNWKQVKGAVKERWGRLTDDDLIAIAGRRDQLEGMIQERYGCAKTRVQKEIEDWYRSMESNLAEQIESLRSGIQNLYSTVEHIAKEQIPHARSRATHAFTDAEEAVAESARCGRHRIRFGTFDWCADATIAPEPYLAALVANSCSAKTVTAARSELRSHAGP